MLIKSQEDTRDILLLFEKLHLINIERPFYSNSKKLLFILYTFLTYFNSRARELILHGLTYHLKHLLKFHLSS